jgi:phage tail-like protein
VAGKYEFSLTIKGPASTKVFKIPVGATLIGRQPGSALLLNDPKVSRQHAQIDCSAQECKITDLNSANGTFVNDERLIPSVPVVLNQRDNIKIGPFFLTLTQAVVPEPKLDTVAIMNKEDAGDRGAPPLPQDAFASSVKPEPVAPEKMPDKLAGHAGTPPPVNLPPIIEEPEPIEEVIIPPGLTIESQYLLNYLPYIYRTDFTTRFLGIFESILMPIEWTIDNFDLFLDPHTAPYDFLAWLANWFQISWGVGWDEIKRRIFLNEAYQIFSLRGTRWALQRILQIYTGSLPVIDDQASDLKPYTFRVILKMKKKEVDESQIKALIEAHKPAFTTYILEYDVN